MSDPGYPEGLSGSDFCHMEGHDSPRGVCRRCGERDYHLMGYYGALGRRAKKLGITIDELESQIIRERLEEAR